MLSPSGLSNSSSSSSSKKSNSNNSSSQSSGSGGVGVGDSIEVPVDPDSYIEFNGGGNSAWGGSFDAPESWYNDYYNK